MNTNHFIENTHTYLAGWLVERMTKCICMYTYIHTYRDQFEPVCVSAYHGKWLFMVNGFSSQNVIVSLCHTHKCATHTTVIYYIFLTFTVTTFSSAYSTVLFVCPIANMARWFVRFSTTPLFYSHTFSVMSVIRTWSTTTCHSFIL